MIATAVLIPSLARICLPNTMAWRLMRPARRVSISELLGGWMRFMWARHSVPSSKPADCSPHERAHQDEQDPIDRRSIARHVGDKVVDERICRQRDDQDGSLWS